MFEEEALRLRVPNSKAPAQELKEERLLLKCGHEEQMVRVNASTKALLVEAKERAELLEKDAVTKRAVSARYVISLITHFGILPHTRNRTADVRRWGPAPPNH